MRSQARHVARRLIVLLATFACVPVDVQGQTAADSKPKKVLALHLVRRDSPQFDDAFRAVLNEALPGQLDYYSEYIDQQRLDEEKYHTALRSYLRARYVDDGIDLVIASGPSVVAFLNGDPSLFEGVPLVFTTRPGLLGGPNSTGIISAIDLASTLSVALQAQPDTKHVYVVSGVAPFDRLYVDILKEQQAPFAGRVIFHDLAGLSLSTIERQVHDLPPHSILFFVGLSDDGAGRTFMPLDAVGPIAAAANVPMYSWHEVALGHGIVGGRLHSSVNDAQETARLAVRVLRGEAPQTIPVKTIDSYAYEFDWRQLQRWNISEDRLPAGSVIRFREASFFQQYRRYVVSGGLVFALQMALIGGLLIQRLRRRRAENALRQSEARNGAILRALPDLMFVLDRNGMYVDFHARDPRDLFTEPDRFLGRTIRDIMPGPLAETFMQALDRAHRSHEPVVVEYELSMGEPRYYEARLVPADHGRVLSIVRDVTESKRAHELNRVLAGRLIVSQEEERQRIARELHDDLSQKIALLNIEVDQMAKEMTVREHRLRLEKLSLQTGQIAGDLYDLSHELHPSRLHTLGLVESVRLLCRDVSQQRGVNVAFSHAGLPDTVDQPVSLCLYRIAQEALHNVAKHSQAPDASVRLDRDGEELHLEISDSGIGFNPHRADHGGLGLVSMRERAGVLKGRLAIDSVPGTGTRISVWVPLIPAGDGHVVPEPVPTASVV